jgi:hypothetical protein
MQLGETGRAELVRTVGVRERLRIIQRAEADCTLLGVTVRRLHGRRFLWTWLMDELRWLHD